MREDVRIQFYRISQCGYYPYGHDTPAFGDLSALLADLKDWVHEDDKSLVETCTFALEDPDSSLRAFCFDIINNSTTGDFLLTIWNESASNEGRIASVRGSDPVGDAEVNFSDLPEDAIPGYATYFWFVPQKNVFASIRFHHSQLTNKENLQRYFKEFIAKFSVHAIYDEDDNEENQIIGYAENDGDKPRKLRAKFRAAPFKNPGKLDYIRSNRELITKIVSRNRLRPTVSIDRTLFQKMLQKISNSIHDTQVTPDIKIRYEIPYTPDENELESIIAEWTGQDESRWDDVGFKVEGDQTTYWLSHSAAKDNIEVDIQRQDDEIVEADSLLQALTERRPQLLNLVE